MISYNYLKCVVEACPGGERLYRIPTRCAVKWCANLQINIYDISGETRICDRHFSKRYIGGLRLKYGAMPTLNLGHDDGPVFQNEPMTIPKNTSTIKLNSIKSHTVPHLSNHSFDENDFSKKNALHAPNQQPSVTNASAGKSNYSKQEKTSLTSTTSQRSLIKEFLCDSSADSTNNTRLTQPYGTVCYTENSTNKKTLQANPILKCSVSGCPSAHRLFRIPRRNQVKWCANLKMQLEDIDSVTRVCERHFSASLIGIRKLKRNAMPTLELGHNDGPLFANEHLYKEGSEKRIIVSPEQFRNGAVVDGDDMSFEVPDELNFEHYDEGVSPYSLNELPNSDSQIIESSFTNYAVHEDERVPEVETQKLYVDMVATTSNPHIKQSSSVPISSTTNSLTTKEVAIKYNEMFEFWNGIIKNLPPEAVMEVRFEVTALLRNINYKYNNS